MAAQDNIEVVTRSYEAFGSGDIDEFREVWDPEIVHVIPGTSPFSGEHRGIDAVLGNLAAMGAASDTMNAELAGLFSDGDDQVLALLSETCERQGRTFTAQSVLNFTLENGKITEIRDFFSDIDSFSTFWS